MTVKAEERLTARVPPRVRELIVEAAQAVGATVNQFLVQSAVEKATEVLERERVITLTFRDAKTIFDLIEEPPEPSQQLKEALRTRESLLCSK